MRGVRFGRRIFGGWPLWRVAVCRSIHPDGLGWAVSWTPLPRRFGGMFGIPEDGAVAMITGTGTERRLYVGFVPELVGVEVDASAPPLGCGGSRIFGCAWPMTRGRCRSR